MKSPCLVPIILGPGPRLLLALALAGLQLPHGGLLSAAPPPVTAPLQNVDEEHDAAAAEDEAEAEVEAGPGPEAPVHEAVERGPDDQQRRLETAQETPRPRETFRANFLEHKHLQRILESSENYSVGAH